MTTLKELFERFTGANRSKSATPATRGSSASGNHLNVEEPSEPTEPADASATPGS
jgi:hypothetical protein